MYFLRLGYEDILFYPKMLIFKDVDVNLYWEPHKMLMLTYIGSCIIFIFTFSLVKNEFACILFWQIK